jgi:hypothetical protein
MRAREEEERACEREAAVEGSPQQYKAVAIPRHMGLDCGRYKWRQNQSHVEVFVALKEGTNAKKVRERGWWGGGWGGVGWVAT